MKKDNSDEISAVDSEGNISKRNFKKKSSPANNYLRYGEYMNIGVYIVVPLVAGVFIGVYLDKWLNTKPLFVLVFILLGTIASFYNLFKITTKKDAPH